MRMPIISLPYMGENSELVVIVRNSESVHGGVEDKVILAPIGELIREEQVLKFYAITISIMLAGFSILNIGLWLMRG